MKTVLAFGTYDLFHLGHEYFLREAKKYGDRLVVVVARDANVERIKGRSPQQDEETRRAVVEEFEAVDEVVLGYEEWGKHMRVLEDIAPNVICLGYDQKAQLPDGDWDVVVIDSFEPEKYKSSLLRE